MACADFQERLIDYADLPPGPQAEIDRHIAECPACRGYWDLLNDLDRQVTKQYGSPAAPRNLESRIRRRIAGERQLVRVSFVPELLDFIGGAVLVAITTWVAWTLAPAQSLALLQQLPLLVAPLAVAGAAWIGARTYASLK